MAADGEATPVPGSPEERIGRLIADSQKGHYEPYNGPSEDDILAVVRAAVAAERGRAYRAMGEVLDDLDAAGLNESEVAERLRDRMDSFRA